MAASSLGAVAHVYQAGEICPARNTFLKLTRPVYVRTEDVERGRGRGGGREEISATMTSGGDGTEWASFMGLMRFARLPLHTALTVAFVNPPGGFE